MQDLINLAGNHFRAILGSYWVGIFQQNGQLKCGIVNLVAVIHYSFTYLFVTIILLIYS